MSFTETKNYFHFLSARSFTDDSFREEFQDHCFYIFQKIKEVNANLTLPKRPRKENSNRKK